MLVTSEREREKRDWLGEVEGGGGEEERRGCVKEQIEEQGLNLRRS